MSLLKEKLFNALHDCRNGLKKYTSADSHYPKDLQAIQAANAAILEYDEQKDDLDAAAMLVHAYARGEARGGSVDWSDLNEAWDKACGEIGPERVAEIKKLYMEDDDEPA